MSNYGIFFNEKIKSYFINDMTAVAKESEDLPFLESALESQQIARHMQRFAGKRKINADDEDDSSDRSESNGVTKQSGSYIERYKYLGHEVNHEVKGPEDKTSSAASQVAKKNSKTEGGETKNWVAVGPDERLIETKELCYKKTLSDIENEESPKSQQNSEENQSKGQFEKDDKFDKKRPPGNQSGMQYDTENSPPSNINEKEGGSSNDEEETKIGGNLEKGSNKCGSKKSSSRNSASEENMSGETKSEMKAKKKI